jgi:hypothetical protein
MMAPGHEQTYPLSLFMAAYDISTSSSFRGKQHCTGFAHIKAMINVGVLIHLLAIQTLVRF